MYKKYIIALSAILLFHMANAQLKGVVTDKKGHPVTGANVVWINSTVSSTTDAKGDFTLPFNGESNKIVVSHPAYDTDTLVVADKDKLLKIELNSVLQLREVSVVSRAPGIIKGRVSVFQTEKITGAELKKAACCNLSESFETNPSVDVSYSDAATGAKQIKLLGLSGTYVQMLNENVPTLRGIASVYGLDYIPGTWMESIQVSKGTSSVVNGYEAITGQINVEYKTPKSEKVAVNLYASDAGRVEANVTATAQLNDKLSTAVLLHGSDDFAKLDQNKDGFMDMPMAKQYNIANKWDYQRGAYVSHLYLRALSEDRTGGQTDHDGYRIGIDSKRYEFFLKNGWVFNSEKERSIGLILSGSIHNQDAYYGNKTYTGDQGNFYANLIFQTNVGKLHKISAGASFNADNYDEKLNTTGVTTLLPRKEYVPGIFAEYRLNLNNKFILLGGVRADYNSLYGSFVTPRLHLKYNLLSDHLLLRASVGKGFRSPNVLAENNNLLASNRTIQIDNGLKMEEAWNYGVSAQGFINLFGRELSLTGEWYYTDFKNQVVADMDANPHAVHFYNLVGKSFSESAQVEASMQVVRGLTFTLAHRINDVQTTIDGVLRQKPLTNRSKSMFTTSYQTPLKKWQFDFTAQFCGGGRLPDPDKTNPLWDKNFKSYTLLNAQVTKYFRSWSLYLGSENLTDFIQKNPIIDVKNPFGNDFDASMIWGPTHGRKVYVGFRWAIDRD